MTFGIGQVFGEAGSLLKEFGRAGAHSLASGTFSHLQGGNFWHGAASGGISSLGGSAMQAMNFSDPAMITGSAALGGLGSKISGGDFWQGFGMGLAVGAFNHAMEHGLSQNNDPIYPPKDPNTGKYILEGFPDAEYQGKSKGLQRRLVFKLKDGKMLEWTSKNGVLEMYDKSGKKWLGKYNPTTGALIDGSSKIGRIASFVGKGITYVATKLSIILNPIFYTGPGSGFETNTPAKLEY